jgi:hypothetical protein
MQVMQTHVEIQRRHHLVRLARRANLIAHTCKLTPEHKLVKLSAAQQTCESWFGDKETLARSAMTLVQPTTIALHCSCQSHNVKGILCTPFTEIALDARSTKHFGYVEYMHVLYCLKNGRRTQGDPYWMHLHANPSDHESHINQNASQTYDVENSSAGGSAKAYSRTAMRM